ncbi:MAG: SpoIIE family protein phosphatase [Deltaproteobacteria bacterium]|nr:SpoIIE family protein phosphatase [Deltaproteobacteria bacterium]
MAEAQVKLLPGDVLVLYTDGIIEARADGGRVLRVERFHAVLERPGGSARQVPEAVLGDLDKFVEDAPQADDQTVVCLAVSEASSKRFESVLPACWVNRSPSRPPGVLRSWSPSPASRWSPRCSPPARRSR